MNDENQDARVDLQSQVPSVGSIAEIATGDAPTFVKELEHLINRYSMEGGSDTPDFILAGFLRDVLIAFNVTMTQRERWYGRQIYTPSTQGPVEPHGVPMDDPNVPASLVPIPSPPRGQETP